MARTSIMSCLGGGERLSGSLWTSQQMQLEGLDLPGAKVYVELLVRFFESASLVSRLLLFVET